MLDTNGIHYKDETGRTLLMRGVNLSGNAKLPFKPDLPSHINNIFFESERSVSFVGRPFPINDADEHFARLRHWGFNFLRFLITWEAIEHKGPGDFDMEYFQYVVDVLHKAKEYDFRCFLDPHQDVWSRFSGGSGAPGWTFKFAGLDIRKFKETGAALVHNVYDHPESFPQMIWPTNYYKLACATMFTLFFAGKIFAPKLIIEENGKSMNIQTFLQTHYFNSIAALAEYIKKEGDLLDNVVVGWDTLNEPSPGFIGIKSLEEFPDEHELRLGATPTPYQSMLLGMGEAAFVELWGMSYRGPLRKGEEYIDPQGVTAWIPESRIVEGDISLNRDPHCLWAWHGVWDLESKKLLIPDYFSKHPKTGEVIDFDRDCFKPFALDFIKSLRKVHKNAVIYIEPPVLHLPPQWTEEDPGDRLAFAPHWYDGLTLVKKSYNSWLNVDVLNAKRGYYFHYATAVKFGKNGINTAFTNQLALIKREREEYLGKVPLVIGEVGIPFDMDNKFAYATADYSRQLVAMNANMCALESELLDFTLWNYCPGNTHQFGDGWNGEDLSIFCKDEQDSFFKSRGEKPEFAFENPKEEESPLKTQIDDTTCSTSDISATPTVVWNDQFINAGGRVLDAVVRPFPIATPGKPLKLHFDMDQVYLYYSYECSMDQARSPFVSNDRLKKTEMSTNPNRTPPRENSGEWVEIYLPRVHFPKEDEVEFAVGHGKSPRLEDSCSGEWRVNCSLQRAWYRCSCYTEWASAEHNGGKGAVFPGAVHTLLIRRCNASGSPGIEKFAKSVFKCDDGALSRRCCPNVCYIL